MLATERFVVEIDDIAREQVCDALHFLPVVVQRISKEKDLILIIVTNDS